MLEYEPLELLGYRHPNDVAVLDTSSGIVYTGDTHGGDEYFGKMRAEVTHYLDKRP